MTSRTGMATAVGLLGGFGERAGEVQQDQLFADLEDDASVPALPLPNPPAPRARTGRPPGARNRSTEQWRELFLSRYRSPLMGLGEIYSMPLEDLARQLNLYKTVDVIEIDQDTGRAKRSRCEDRTLLDLEKAFRIQQDARATALPYIHQKQPLAVEARSSQRGMVVIEDLLAVAEGEEGEFGLAVPGDAAVDVTPPADGAA